MTAPVDRARTQALRRAPDPTDFGGLAIIWYREGGRLVESRLTIQPGVADELESLLSALAIEIGWPGAPPSSSSPHVPADAVACWARVWQVRAWADLRLSLWWDTTGVLQGAAVHRDIQGKEGVLLTNEALAATLDRVARCAVASTSPHALLLAGNRAMDAGDYGTARAAYERAVIDLPRHALAHRNLALALARRGDWATATARMREAVNLAPSDQALLGEYLAMVTDAGIRAAAAGDAEGAAAYFLEILTRWPDEPTALANLGTIRQREGRNPEARAIYQRFLRHHPQHPAADTIRAALAALPE